MVCFVSGFDCVAEKTPILCAPLSMHVLLTVAPKRESHSKDERTIGSGATEDRVNRGRFTQIHESPKGVKRGANGKLVNCGVRITRETI